MHISTAIFGHQIVLIWEEWSYLITEEENSAHSLNRSLTLSCQYGFATLVVHFNFSDLG